MAAECARRAVDLRETAEKVADDPEPLWRSTLWFDQVTAKYQEAWQAWRAAVAHLTAAGDLTAYEQRVAELILRADAWPGDLEELAQTAKAIAAANAPAKPTGLA